MEEGRLISDSEESCLDCDCHFSLSYFLYLGKNAYIQSVRLAKPAYLPTEHINNARICSFFKFFCLVILPEKVIVPEKLTPSSAWSSSPVTPVDRSNAQPKSREVGFTEWTYWGLPWWLRRQRICLQCYRDLLAVWPWENHLSSLHSRDSRQNYCEGQWQNAFGYGKKYPSAGWQELLFSLKFQLGNQGWTLILWPLAI